MTVDAFRLKNFMAFRDTGWIELRAITLLFGRNSSGKSAIIRALRLLKQSLYNGQDNEVLRFAVEGQLDLGDFEAALHRRPETDDEVETIEGRKISFAFRGDLLGNEIVTVRQQVNQSLAALGYSARVGADRETIDFELEFGYNHLEHRVQLVGVHIDCPWPELEATGKTNFLSASRISLADDAGTKWQTRWFWESDFGLEQIVVEEAIPWETIQIVLISGFLPGLDTTLSQFERQTLMQNNSIYEILTALLTAANKSVENFLNRIEYLGPIRPEPRRLYLLDRFQIQRWQQQGLTAWINILQGGLANTVSESDLDKSKQHQAPSELEIDKRTTSSEQRDYSGSDVEMHKTPMSRWLATLGLGTRLLVNPFPLANAPGIAAQVEIEQTNGTSVNLADVGYGASQILPIIAACVNAKKGSLIIIEQPELHLHSEAQANLADLFIQTIHRVVFEEKDDKDGETLSVEFIPSNIKFLIETHSEHILLRMRRRIPETAFIGTQFQFGHILLVKSQLETYFVYKNLDKSTSTVNVIRFDKLGSITEMPITFRNFFDTDTSENAELTRLRAKAELPRKENE